MACKPPLIFSFFSGAGFLDLGFEKAGYEIAYVNEVHKPFLDAYKHARKQMNTPPRDMAILKGILNPACLVRKQSTSPV